MVSVSEIQNTIGIMLRYKSYDALQDYVKRHSPLPFEAIKDITDSHLCQMISSIKSKMAINATDLLIYPKLRDVGYTEIRMPDELAISMSRKVAHQTFKMMARCFRGHFSFSSNRLFKHYMHWWLIYVPYIGPKYDWIWTCPSNILHIRREYYWVYNPSMLSSKVSRKLDIRYRLKINVRQHTQIVQLDEHSIDFIKGLFDKDISKKLRTLQYRIMHKSLFDMVIGEHIRIHSSESPDIRRWSANYGFALHRLSSPSLVLSYAATSKPDELWKSPIFIDDLDKEREVIMYYAGL